MKNNQAVILTAKQAIDCLPDGENIHVIIVAYGLIGINASCERKSIIDVFRKAKRIEIGGEMCKSFGCGIVVIPKEPVNQDDFYFVECDDEKLATYEKKAKRG